MPRKGLSHPIRKTRSTENTRARRRRGGGKARRRAAQNLVLSQMWSPRQHPDLLGPPEPVPDWRQLQNMLGLKRRAKRIQLQTVQIWKEKRNPKNIKNRLLKRRKRRERKMKSRGKSPHHLKAAQLQVLSLKVKEVKYLVIVNFLQLLQLKFKNRYPEWFLKANKGRTKKLLSSCRHLNCQE